MASSICKEDSVKNKHITSYILSQAEQAKSYNSKTSFKHEDNNGNDFIEKIKKHNSSISQLNNNQAGATHLIKIEQLLNDVKQLKSLSIMKKISTELLVKLLYKMNSNINEELPALNELVNKPEIMSKAVNSCLISLYIMTSPSMPKRVYLEEIIETVIIFIKSFLSDILFPIFDYNYHDINKSGCNQAIQELKASSLVAELYNKSKDLIKLTLELLQIQRVDKNIVIHISQITYSSFITNNIIELQFLFKQLVGYIFNSYEEHRIAVLELLLSSLIQLPDEKRLARNYTLLDGVYVHIYSVIFIHLLQSSAILSKNSLDKMLSLNNHKEIDKLMFCRYKQVTTMAGTFLTMLLHKCENESNLKTIFENLIYDLAEMLNNPESPSAGLIINIVVVVLVNNFSNSKLDSKLRLTALDLLSNLTIKLEKSVKSTIGINEIYNIICAREGDSFEVKSEKQDMYLKQFLLHYLFLNSEVNNDMHVAMYFNIISWYIDTEKSLNNSDVLNLENKDAIKKRKTSKQSTISKKHIEIRKGFMNMLQPIFNNTFQDSLKCIDYKSAKLIIQYLNQKEEPLDNLEQILRSIIIILKDPSPTIRIKAMQCFTTVIAMNVLLLIKPEIQTCINNALLDQSPAVRELTAGLIGKYITQQPQIIDKYYDVLSTRILDTNVSVRKRVFKIFQEVCNRFPDFHKITDIHLKMIKRVNDEKSINKLVIENFSSLWFTPCNKATLEKKVKCIFNVVKDCDDTTLESFKKLLFSIYNLHCKETDSIIETQLQKPLFVSFNQIIEYMIQRLSISDVIISLRILHIFSQIQPDLILKYMDALQPYLNSSCETIIVSIVIQILQQMIPLIAKKAQRSLKKLQDNLIILMWQCDTLVMCNAISCVKTIMNITQNYAPIRNCLKWCYNYLSSLELPILENITNKDMQDFRRITFITGLLLKTFDSDDANIIGDLPKSIQQDILDLYLVFLQQNNADIQLSAVRSIGLVSLRYKYFLSNKTVKQFYNHILTSKEASHAMRLAVLKNIEMYLMETNKQVNSDTKADIKTIEDSGRIISLSVQCYIKEILQAYIHPSLQTRQLTFGLIQIILQQGVANPLQIIPYLICASTDFEKMLAYSADKLLHDLNRTYPEYFFTKALAGVKLSYELQEKLQSTEIIKGFKINSSNEYPSALNNFLFSLLSGTKRWSQFFIKNIIQEFDNENLNLKYLLYLSDNLAYFAYGNEEELLFLMYQMDRIIACTGDQILESFKNSMKKNDTQEDRNVSDDDDDDDDENECLLLRQFPDDISSLQTHLKSSQKILLLLFLKQYLQNVYGITDLKVHQYCLSRLKVSYEKPLCRYKSLLFNPEYVISELCQEYTLDSSNSNQRKELVQKYLYFKKLMFKFDRTNLDNDLYTDEILNLENPKTSHIKEKGTQKIKVNKRKAKKRRSNILKSSFSTEESDSEEN